MPVRRIRTLEELKSVVDGGSGYLYNDFGGSKPKDCPIHHVSCRQVPRMLSVKPGNLSVKKAWCKSLEELVRWIRDEGKVHAFCSDATDPVGQAGAPSDGRHPAGPGVPTPRPVVAPAKTGTDLPILRRATRVGREGDASVLDAVAAVMESYRQGDIEIRTEADLQGHLFAALLPRLKGHPSPLHANLSLVSPREKIDLVIGRECIMELKVEADYPGVTKPVVFPEDVWKDLKRLNRYVQEKTVEQAYFLMLDQDGSHARRRETAGLWEHASAAKKPAHWLFLVFPPAAQGSSNP